MKVKEILNYIPGDILEHLAIEHKVDHQVKKLEGMVLFQLLLYSILSEKRNSLRVMEEFYTSYAFRQMVDVKDPTIKFNAISARLAAINPDYFEAIFKNCCERFARDFPVNEKEKAVLAYDSTLVSISSKLIKHGMKINRKGDKRFVKFSIGFNQIPVEAHLYNQQLYISEDIALGDAILKDSQSKENVIVFDRGVQSRKTYDGLTDKERFFVSRLRESCTPRFKLITTYEIKEKESETFIVESDQQVQLYNKKNKLSKHYIRLITGKEKQSGNPIFFVSNIEKMSAVEITEIYRRRWDIEVFFRFIKQELNFEHLISRSLNGIKVMLYMTLIAAILLTVYKKHNKLSGYKIPRLKFLHELEGEILMDIVQRCGGNPLKFKELFPT